ncbi:MAG: hypothetical protein K2G49_03220 [Muribaculum sp.]|nr:hypothetical protein [Muribaculum sp.]
MTVNASNVGASGSSPAFRPPCLRCVRGLDYDVASFWGWIACPQSVCFGRASTRPYSYAMCVIAVIYSLLRNDCPCSYAMIANTSNVGASGSSPAFRLPCLRWVCVGL